MCISCRNIDSRVENKNVLDLIDKHCNDMCQKCKNKFKRIKTGVLAAILKNISHACEENFGKI